MTDQTREEYENEYRPRGMPDHGLAKGGNKPTSQELAKERRKRDAERDNEQIVNDQGAGNGQAGENDESGQDDQGGGQRDQGGKRGGKSSH
ncbi:hypothetical protein FRC08_008443 [Ceratobasidium sp. 394]|nr:hypothetical protein FRC08_008443 [Ceratobasidium sp. 394]KAG9093227.1 hypothetical protein FS749_014812 [Ceratobasidium sp. UAMH 11750]